MQSVKWNLKEHVNDHLAITMVSTYLKALYSLTCNQHNSYARACHDHTNHPHHLQWTRIHPHALCFALYNLQTTWYKDQRSMFKGMDECNSRLWCLVSLSFRLVLQLISVLAILGLWQYVPVVATWHRLQVEIPARRWLPCQDRQCHGGAVGDIRLHDRQLKESISQKLHTKCWACKSIKFVQLWVV